MDRLAVYCADVGSIRQGNFGWARADVPASDIELHRGGSEIFELVDALTADLDAGLPGALGFECPLFVPVPEDPLSLGAARAGEGSRPWSATPGTGALATGLVQAGWVLAELRRRRASEELFLDWGAFVAGGRGLFLWEAFVTDRAKGTTHIDDATIAVACFCRALPYPDQANAVRSDRPFSLIGAAALWSGWTSDVALLRASCLVLRAAAKAL